ncbi:MAG: transketolase, partial [Pseudomonadota bacterium]|nr:transketolase [Pseudomonadota bacterium]
GHLRLAKLIVLWDDNGISIDGRLALADSTDQLQRFAASGWQVMRVDGHDPEAVAAALTAAQAAIAPSLIACKTIIGYGAPSKQGTAATHGSPLGAEEILAARERLGWNHAPFVVPDHVAEEWRSAGARGTALRADWEQRVVASPAAVRDEFARRIDGVLPTALDEALRDYKTELSKAPGAVATRNASQNTLEIINAVVPETIGGSADLTGSNNTQTKGLKPLTAQDSTGRYIHYGIREHAMAAAMNGMAVHGGVIPYGGTFLTFADYCRPAIRLSAIMRQRVIYVMTHDSIGLGEDGPTHQPIEHLAALRAIPNLLVMRPCDAVETAECWEIALKSKDTPSILALTRQKLKPARLTFEAKNLCRRGAYEIQPVPKKSKAVIFASGSEVEIALTAQHALDKRGISARVVSVPCMELFEQQSPAYRDQILGAEKARVAVEAGASQGWQRFIGAEGSFIGMSGFGASAPFETLYQEFGLTAEAVAKAVRKAI